MTCTLELHPLAVHDIADAIEWYEAESPGLGERFRAEVFEQLRKILDNPRLYPHAEGSRYRKCALRIFPFCIYYALAQSRIVVLSVHDARRDPARWRKRHPS
jgi:plasmid stabilization system protein ParE